MDKVFLLTVRLCILENLRASGPMPLSAIRRSLLAQCSKVTPANVDEISKVTLASLAKDGYAVQTDDWWQVDSCWKVGWSSDSPLITEDKRL